MAVKVGDNIILITDKELFHYDIFKRPLTLSWKLFFRLIINARLYALDLLIKRSLKRLSATGKILICHFGNNFSFVEKVDKTINFILAPAEFCTEDNHIAMTSRDFISPIYQEMSSLNPRKLHFLMVSNISNNKRQLEIFDAISNLINFERYSGYGVFVSPRHHSETQKTHQIELIKKFILASTAVREQISLARASEELGFTGFTGPLIPLLMSESKYLILASKHEGEPRVVNEAIQAGCTVLYTDELKFTKPAIMNTGNSRKFSDTQKLIDFLEQDCIKHDINLRKQNVIKFCDALQNRGMEANLVKELNDYLNVSEGLDRILPGHSVNKEKWFVGKSGYPNNELKTIRAVIKFSLHA